MKITFIIQDLFLQGAQYVTALMIRGFVQDGYEVDLIVSQVHQKMLAETIYQPFEVPRNTNIIVLPAFKARNNIMALRNYLRTTHTRAVIAMSPNYMWSLAIASLGVRNCPLISYVEHSGFITQDEKCMQIVSPRKFSLQWVKSKFLTSRFPVIMAVSKGTAKAVEIFMALPAGRVKTVYNPVIDNLFYEKLKQQSTHPWLQHKDIPTFIAAGAHCKLKGHLMLFEAIKLANKVTPVRLVLFGRGELTDTYKKWIEDNQMQSCIDIAPFTSNLPAEVKSADALIVSSIVESFSVVLVEAMAAGTPVISTRCPYGPPELLQDGKYGVLVPVGDSSAMAQALINQANNPNSIVPKEAWMPYTLERVVDSYKKALDLEV